MDKKHKKKLKRASKKRKEKNSAHKAQLKIKQQMSMFDKLPDTCSSCVESFPKTREAHMSWRVVVRNDKQQVRLFCPKCQEKVKTAMEKKDEI